ncbi:Uncharacterised protein [Nocardia farcinica]|uniref:Uncharacterized protein n=1 Tax=Nocardia farcinica TaxID=37329 RepID=A0A449HAX6_NOCFR|nr:Uncharacterised protein [Nocardia farcinica]
MLIDGHSRLEIDREPDGRIRIAVHDREASGYAVTFGAASAAEIAAFLTLEIAR